MGAQCRVNTIISIRKCPLPYTDTHEHPGTYAQSDSNADEHTPMLTCSTHAQL